MVSDKPLYCSFCGKNQHEVQKLIAGPQVLICDECTVLCMSIIMEEGKKLKGLAGDEMRGLFNQLSEEQKTALLAANPPEVAESKKLSELVRNLEFECEAYIAALLDIAFPDHSGLNDWHGNPGKWSSSRAYEALGGRIEGGRRIDTYEDLKGDE